MIPFVNKLCHGAPLTDADKAALVGLAQPARRIAAHQDIAAEGDKLHWLPLILEGWACRYRLLENGKRQIISLLVPGDLCEPFGVLPRFMDTSLGALTPVILSFLPLDAVKSIVQASSTIGEALWWDLLMASEIEREHIVSLGRRSALERLGHLFCELHLRLTMAGLVEGSGYDFPITQADMSDLLGLSSVHVNRSLQDLRKTGLVSLRGRRLIIHALDELRELSLFNEAHLKLRDAITTTNQ